MKLAVPAGDCVNRLKCFLVCKMIITFIRFQNQSHFNFTIIVLLTWDSKKEKEAYFKVNSNNYLTINSA